MSILSVVDNLSEGEIWIVMELMNEGPLDAYCYKEKKDVLNVQQKVHISIQCWSALSYLHDNARITHQDIKPENILVNWAYACAVKLSFYLFVAVEHRTKRHVDSETLRFRSGTTERTIDHNGKFDRHLWYHEISAARMDHECTQPSPG